MGIPIGKLSLYTACRRRTASILLAGDAGCGHHNRDLLTILFISALRQERVRATNITRS